MEPTEQERLEAAIELNKILFEALQAERLAKDRFLQATKLLGAKHLENKVIEIATNG